jgi:uncharacterized protein (DUF2062 family)
MAYHDISLARFWRTTMKALLICTIIIGAALATAAIGGA